LLEYNTLKDVNYYTHLKVPELFLMLLTVMQK